MSGCVGRQTGTVEWRAARGELGTKPPEGAVAAAHTEVATNNTTTLLSTPGLHSHKLDDTSLAGSLLESAASAAAAGRPPETLSILVCSTCAVWREQPHV